MEFKLFITGNIDNKIFHLVKKTWERFKVHHAYHFNNKKREQETLTISHSTKKLSIFLAATFRKRLIKVIYGWETIFGS